MRCVSCGSMAGRVMNNDGICQLCEPGVPKPQKTVAPIAPPPKKVSGKCGKETTRGGKCQNNRPCRYHD